MLGDERARGRYRSWDVDVDGQWWEARAQRVLETYVSPSNRALPACKFDTGIQPTRPLVESPVSFRNDASEYYVLATVTPTIALVF